MSRIYLLLNLKLFGLVLKVLIYNYRKFKCPNKNLFHCQDYIFKHKC